MRFAPWQVRELLGFLKNAGKGLPCSHSWTLEGSDRGDGFPLCFAIRARDGEIRMGLVTGVTSVLRTSPERARTMRDLHQLAVRVQDRKKGWYA